MRIKSIDILRAIAILGVLLRHSSLDTWFARAGWAGVDLFFVLSGFLVSGILFKEFLTSGHVNIKRFLIRRGFKIYPAFYVFLVISLLIEVNWFKIDYPSKNIFSEVFFMQSYIDGCFLHTWSLAIEEHFYLFLAFSIFFIVKKRLMYKTRSMIIYICLATFIVIILRFQYVCSHLNMGYIYFFKTHLRIDGLLIGVLLSYFYYFLENTASFIHRKFKTLILLSLFFISLPFFVKADSFFMLTIGLTIMQIGFGIIVIMSMYATELPSMQKIFGYKIMNILAYIGKYSYSIYIWHLFLREILNKLLNKEPPLIIYLLTTILGGIAFSLLIEQVFLKVRNRLIPT